MGVKKCVYCDNDLKGKQRKYCSSLCKYRYISILKDKPRSLSKAQCLRMVKAGRAQRAGRVGCRYN